MNQDNWFGMFIYKGIKNILCTRIRTKDDEQLSALADELTDYFFGLLKIIGHPFLKSDSDEDV